MLTKIDEIHMWYENGCSDLLYEFVITYLGWYVNYYLIYILSINTYVVTEISLFHWWSKSHTLRY